MTIDNEVASDGVVNRVYDHLGLDVDWYPALVEKFGDRLGELAERIIDELVELDTLVVYFHVFDFEDERVIIRTSYREAEDLIIADAVLGIQRQYVEALR
jgi:hypothetical protein